MAESFRLLYLKSADFEKPPFVESSPSFKDELDSERSLSTSEYPLPENFSSREVLKQAKADLKHPDPKVRILAVQYYLEKSNLSITLPDLQEILEDEDPGVRAQALASLIKFGNPVVSPFLKRHLKDVDHRVRMIALRGIFQLKEKIDSNLLKQFTSDDSPWVRRKMATLLGWREVEGGLPLLVEMAKDREPMVRKAALSSLLILYPEEGENRMLEAMADPDKEVRKWVRDQLNRMLQRPLRRNSHGPLR